MRKSCVIYDAWAVQIVNLPVEMAGEYAQALMRYAIFEEDVTFENPALNAMFASAKPILDADAKKYRAKVDRINANSARSRNDIATISERNQNDIAHVNDNDNDTDNKYIKKNTKKKNTFHNFSERSIDFKALAGGSDV